MKQETSNMWNQFAEQPVNEKVQIYDKFGQMRIPLSIILEKIAPKIESGSYGLIIGDDASGRIPAEILADVIKAIYLEKGFVQPKVMFFAGSTRMYERDRKIKQEKISDFFKKLPMESVENALDETNETKPVLSRREGDVLIVTDWISSGKGLTPLVSALEENHIKSDVAVLYDVDRDTVSWEDHIISGEMKEKPGIYGASIFSGVIKRSEDLFSRSTDSAQSVKTARAQQNRIAQELFQEWAKKHQKE